MIYIVNRSNMARGRKAIHQTDEERNNAIKESKMKYYKKNRVELLKKQSDRYHNNKSADDVDGITYEAFDDASGDW